MKVIRRTEEYPYPQIDEVRFFEAAGTPQVDLTVNLGAKRVTLTVTLSDQTAIVQQIKQGAVTALRDKLVELGYTEYDV